MSIAALVALLTQAASTVTTAVDSNSPITAGGVVLILGALGGFLLAFGTFAGTIVNAFLTLRNGMKSDLNAAKADVTAAKVDAAAVKAETTSVKVDQLHALIEKPVVADPNAAKTQPLAP